MTASNGPTRQLPAKPSLEHLRKQAKRLAKSAGLSLADAQREIAASYGYRDWTALKLAVEKAALPPSLSPLSQAALRGDADAVRVLLDEGAAVEGNDEISAPLWHACASDAVSAQKIAVVTALLDAGASPRQHGENQATALHIAARTGPLALVELLIRRSGLSWMQDKRGKDVLHYARNGTAADKDEIVALLDRPVIRDANFRTAVNALHAGDVATLERALDAHPNLLHDRAVEPDCYPPGYFRDPKLFWFIANNPNLRRHMPPNIVESTRAMIARGVEKGDLDYALELVMTNGQARPEDKQNDLIALLLEAGATPTAQAIVMTLAHMQLDPVRLVLARGVALTAPIAAAMGHMRELPALLTPASPEERQQAFGLAVINRQMEAARLCLDAGADVNAFLPVHRHSLPLHQAAINDDIEMLKLLVARGAKRDQPDQLWNSTPLGWAIHGKHKDAEAYLRSLDVSDR
jgi:ankyrin repeat protein